LNGLRILLLFCPSSSKGLHSLRVRLAVTSLDVTSRRHIEIRLIFIDDFSNFFFEFIIICHRKANPKAMKALAAARAKKK